MSRLDTTLWETERQDDDTCVELDDIPGTHNWWCATAPQARALAQQHAASLGLDPCEIECWRRWRIVTVDFEEHRIAGARPGGPNEADPENPRD